MASTEAASEPESRLEEPAAASQAAITAKVEAEGHGAAHAGRTGTPAPPARAENMLRVDAERIDSVLNLVGELILAKSMFQQTVLEFEEHFPKHALRGKFADVLAFHARVLNDLQRSVMKIRMVPVEQLYRRFPRVVRDVARQSGKEVELVVRGGQTDLDKGILDAIAEPLTHLVRNAIGHGLESPAERARAGKRAQGTLRLGAYHQGNQVVIEVSDDGAGHRRGQSAPARGVPGDAGTGAGARLNEAETLELIPAAGVLDGGGDHRTVGARRGARCGAKCDGAAERNGADRNRRGRGTTFRLRLPLTLAIIRALLFRARQRLYALPLNAVTEIARSSEDEIHRVERYEVLQLRGTVLPLLRLGPALAAGPDAAQAQGLCAGHQKRRAPVRPGGGRNGGRTGTGHQGAR